ncbi:MAG: type II toxin-antitoxin system ParD family antitoxin [Candidatus Vogelbacteria bacterium]|nr:type II toxin-antitoxin system ParD family antitoxin [Candidatus Vogelbacteria bacterium]
MSTISVPLPANLEEFVTSQVKLGNGANKADVIRKALRRMAEEEVINAILKSQKQVKEGKILRGDLREIAKKFK